jgi:hypothetical protein
MSAFVTYLAAELRHRWRAARETKDAGYSTEAVVVTALLISLAVVVIGIIAIKVIAKANSINL